MEVYTASDGGVTPFDKALSDYESLDQLVNDISAASGVGPENVLLFLDDGRELRPEILHEMWERGLNGVGSSSSSRPSLYLYNRETFWTEPERWAVELQEDVQLPPAMEIYAGHADSSQVQQPFLIAHDHLLHLQSLYQAQTRAVEIAYANLFHHLQPLLRDFQTFATRTEGDLDTEAGLIRGSKVDMVLLPKVNIHEGLLVSSRKKDRGDGSGTGSGEGGVNSETRVTKTLGDFVSLRKMEEVRKSCRTSHESHVEQYNQLVTLAEEMAAESEAHRRESEERASEVGHDFTEGLSRIEAALTQIEILMSTQPDGFEQDILELDQGMRDDLVALTGVKNEFTLHVHVHLRNVANLQIQLNDFVKPLTALDSDLRSKVAFPHLVRLRQLSFAYGAAVIEVVRRTEFSTFLLEWTSRLEEALAKYTSNERKRRLQYRNDVQSNLPWTVTQLEDSMSPNVEISVDSGADSLAGMHIGRGDIDNLMKWVVSVKDDPDILQAIEEGDSNPIAFLQASLEALIASMEAANGELERTMERSVFGKSSPSESLDRLRLEDKGEHERRLAEVETEHETKVRHLVEQHDQRTTALQTRQAELQDELMRLRVDLGEEMLAREALSAELESQAREHEDKQREQEDQSDLLTALQADMAQEKDRATDLGVRLQEALLDVDGLKSAEQTLIAQLQELQEERSKSLQSLGEVQLHAQGLESQLAGLKAEMEAVSIQLVQARSDRDTALKNQSAEAERMMRDHIAEADGDRAVLEHQNLTLSKQLEDLKVEMEEKLSAAKNAAVRQADSLTAELKFTKAQLRDAQRRETILADELAMAKDSATASAQKENHQAEVTRDAVALAAKYHDCNQRLLTAINGSTTINGSASVTASRPKSPLKIEDDGEDNLNESVLIRSLVTASAFDLGGFFEAVSKIIVMVKKYSKKAKQYRDEARNKIAFSNFTNGDLAMFLPTRNSNARSWAAFNISAPHNFLKVTDAMQEPVKTREWIIARIVKTEEAIASGGIDSPQTNPFGLAEGLRYYTHHVEEYNPSVARSSRRSASTNYVGSSTIADPSHGVSTSGHRQVGSESAMEGIISPTPGIAPARSRTSSGYFPPLAQIAQSSTMNSLLQAENENDDAQVMAPIEGDPPITASLEQSVSQVDGQSAINTVVPRDVQTIPEAFTQTSPPTTQGGIEVPRPTSARPAPSLHQRTTSRSSALNVSPPSFQPFTNRPSSVASSNTSYRNPIPPGTISKSSLAPAMTITTSSDGTSSTVATSIINVGRGTPVPEFSYKETAIQRKTLRKTPSTLSLSPGNGENILKPSTLKDMGLPDIGASVVPITGSTTTTFGNGGGTPPFAKPPTGGTVTTTGKETGIGLGGALSQAPKILGFGLGKKQRTTSVSSSGGTGEKSNAEDLLKKFTK